MNFRGIGKALVTGATGFVGGTLVERLIEAGVSVQALVRDKEKAYHLKDRGAGLVQGYVLSIDSLKRAVTGIDTVFHAAAVTGPAYLSAETYRSINAGGTRNMIEACHAAGCVQRFVHISTVGVLGPLKYNETACETDQLNPADVYEKTKLEGETIAMEAAGKGFPVVVARPSWIYGPRAQGTLKLFRMIAGKRFLIIGKASNKHHPVWIKDVIDGLLKCATVAGIEGRVFHLAGPEIITASALCQTIAEAVGVEIWPVRLPVWSVRYPVLAMDKIMPLVGIKLPIDYRKVDFFRVNRAYSISKAREELQWEPTVTFREGVAQTLQYFREKDTARIWS